MALTDELAVFCPSRTAPAYPAQSTVAATTTELHAATLAVLGS